MNTRRSFLYSLVALPIAALVATFPKPKPHMEITSEDLLYGSRPLPQGMTFKWNKEKKRWDSSEPQ